LLVDGFVEIMPYRRKSKFNEGRSRAISFDMCTSLHNPWVRSDQERQWKLRLSSADLNDNPHPSVNASLTWWGRTRTRDKGLGAPLTIMLCQWESRDGSPLREYPFSGLVEEAIGASPLSQGARAIMGVKRSAG
jgi:hypothetical protein